MKHDVVVGITSSAVKPGEAFIVSHPGEFEIAGITITGITIPSGTTEGKDASHGEERTIWKVVMEDITLAHLDRIQRSELTPAILDGLGDIDMLLLPVGNEGSLSPEEAVYVMNQIEPRIVIPMRYEVKKGKGQLDEFLKEAGETAPQKMPKLVTKKKNLPQDENTQVILLEPVYSPGK